MSIAKTYPPPIEVDVSGVHVFAKLCALVAVVALTAAVTPVAEAAISPVPATSPDVAAVAALNGLTPAAAADFAALQVAVEALGSSLSEDPAVTAYWITPNDGGSLVIGVKDPRSVKAILASLPTNLQSRATFVQQQFSEKELGVAASTAARSYVQQGTPAFGTVDVRAQMASVVIQDASLQGTRGSATSSSSATDPTGVPVTVVVGELPQPSVNLYAGLAGNLCTSGFTVVTSGGTRGVTTAAHCGDIQTFNSAVTTFRFAWQSAAADVQWHTASGQTFRNWAYDGQNDATSPYYRVISGTLPRLSLVIGGTYCKYGVVTGYGCGALASRTETPFWVSGATPTFLAIDNASQVISQRGDSGGPTFSGGNAVGLVSGTADSGHRLVSMSMDGFAGLPISVATS